MLKISVRKGKLYEAKNEAVILPLFEGREKLVLNAREIDKKTGGLISEIIASRDFEAKPFQVSVIYTRGLLPAKRVALVGLGNPEEFDLEKMRGAYAMVMQKLRAINVRQAATAIDFNDIHGSKDMLIRATLEGAVSGLYQYLPFRTVDRQNIKEVKELAVITQSGDYTLVKAEAQKARVIMEAVYFTRDIVSAPANEMTPSILARKARELARRRNITCKVLDKAQMKKIGMNALLGVAAGSCEAPKFIILEYKGKRKSEKPLVLVGKGLTFDTGGISIKPSEKMDEMKTDMAGGAAVMGAIMAAADLRLELNIVGLIPATENMPGGSALKPGDILKSHSGKTIEIINTDAEGRLILADALSFAVRYKPAAIIDVATLTGACVIALGDDVTGMLGTDNNLKREIAEAGQIAGELVWELPLWDMYSEQIKSDIADYKNTGGRAAGAITAAAFLEKFTGNYPWVHLDIAGPAFSTKDKPYIPKGASGIPLRLLVEFLSGRAGVKSK
ncbi:MAG TPA: leucyl aminopeptidase [Deltaproteobacteria bacterium]|nr:leucyl aminopeptidase [Deltaproteobacteria bacterium]